MYTPSSIRLALFAWGLYASWWLNNGKPEGTACRLPGGITSPSNLWDFLVNKRSAQGRVPSQRFNIGGFYSPDGSRAGVLDAAGGYFLQEDVRQFENNFFGINNLEAVFMDPQQRKLLEVVFECFESAGVTLEQISGTSTGVYVGNFTIDHQTMQTRDPDTIHRYTATGCGTTILANRISHVFNLQGPSFTLDTACSSSLYCLHNAVTAIKAGDCEGAIVAAVNLIMSPEQCLGTAKAGVLSPTSTCHTFDISADGYGRAEGANAVYLKRLSSALRDGDKIWAVVRGTAVNSNGRTPGITQPSADLQEAVIRKAYAGAGMDFADTDYVECHGTGTPVGDPIELDAIGRCFSPRRGAPLMIGSSKPNLGHSEAASGLTSLIKVALAFDRGEIPPTYGVKHLNPKLRLDSLNIKVVTEVKEWPRALQRASVNAFGYGGANAHAVLESLDSYLAQNECNGAKMNSINTTNGINGATAHVNGVTKTMSSLPAAAHQFFVLPVSAISAKSLEARVHHVRQAIKLAGDSNMLQSLAHVLAEQRSHFSSRRVLLVRAVSGTDGNLDPHEVEVEDVESAANSDNNNTDSPINDPLPLGFVFTGQGAQYATMGEELLHSNPDFLATIRKLDGYLQTLPPGHAPTWTLEQTMLDPPETSQVHHVTRSQPVCTAIQIALVDLLRDWGITLLGGGVVGHSSGEIAAAYAAGLINARQAILVAYFRGHAVGQLRAEGAMLAAGIGAEAAEKLLQEEGLEGKVCVACVNGPESVTLSGTVEGVELLMAKIQGQKKFARKLQTDGRAYHSHMMKDVGGLYEELLTPYLEDQHMNGDAKNGDHNIKTPDVNMYSSVGLYRDTDGPPLVNDCMAKSAKYWRNNLESPVQFSQALEALLLSNSRKKLRLVEIGPHPQLKGPIKQIHAHMKRDKSSLPYTSTLVRDQDADLCLKKLARTLFLRGHSLCWGRVNPRPVSHTPRHKHPSPSSLPPYPWDYSAGLLWHEPRDSSEIRNRRHLRHELLGSQRTGGNGINWSWRNVLRLREVPWLRDHKLESQIVFPAAAYLAMAMEAVSQIRESAAANQSFHFRNVSINAALVLSDDDADMEIHTTMSSRVLSTTSMSADWYDFSISSWAAAGRQPRTHCAGSIQVLGHDNLKNHDVGLITNPVVLDDAHLSAFEQWSSTSSWYNKFESEGLCFGANFQSVSNLQTDSHRARYEAVCTTPLSPFSPSSHTHCPVHPVTIDACLQAAIMSTAAGDVSALHVYLPVFIDECMIRGSTGTHTLSNQNQNQAVIHARSTRTGLSTQRIDCTLRDTQGTPIVHLQHVRMARYAAKVAKESPAGPRQPCLRVRWKPDIQQLGPVGSSAAEKLRRYIDSFVQKQLRLETDLADDERLAVMGCLLDLVGHKNPNMRVLELGEDCGCKARQLRELLGQGTGFQRCKSWTTGKIDEHGKLVLDDNMNNGDGSFDVVVIPGRAASHDYWGRAAETILSALAPGPAVIITRAIDEASTALNKAGFTVIEVAKQMILATTRPQQILSTNKDQQVVLILRDSPSPAIKEYASVLQTYLQQQAAAADAKTISLGETSSMQFSKDTICISLLEIEREFLASMGQHDMDLLRGITNNVTSLLWLTGADMLGHSPNPALTLCNGLSRALMLEQPSLCFVTLDVGAPASALGVNNIHTTCANVVRALELTASSSSAASNETKDKEFIQHNGLLHISRFGPDLDVNSLFCRRLEPQTQTQKHGGAIQKAPLATARPAQLAIETVGVTDTIHFKQAREPPTSIPPGWATVVVRAVSLNAKDVYALNGRVETRLATTMLEFSGVVAEVGSGVSHLQPGDRVVVLAPSCFSTTLRVPAWAAHKMLPGEAYAAMATLPVAFATALYALRERARLRAGETVLVHGGSGAFGMAAVAVAQRIGATVYTTAGSPEKRGFVASTFGIPEDHVFHSRDASFVAGLKSATGGRGVDVVVNSLVGDLMHSSWRCLAPFGRFVEVGKRELVDAGKLDMDMFLSSVTFTAFDLSDLFFHQDQYYQDILCSLTKEVLALYRSGEIKPAPITTFSVSDIIQAYRYFSAKDRVGKIVISLEDENARIPVAPSRYLTLFSHEKVYLLVGCLGGLGRSLSRWMVARGARNFVFLNRSGCDKPSARDLVSHLEQAGAQVTVVRGDVTEPAHVTAAVTACTATGKPVGGVVQAAMGLHEGLFSRASSKAWHTATRPKVAGTWNLHSALEGHEATLEFFLLMSSVSGSVGTATESNYCAANCFLDAFARWRRSQGKPAVSVGLGMISEVGYLHENSDIEALLLRRGIQPLSEAEFLQVIDIALAGAGQHFDAEQAHRDDPFESSSHLLTGLEPFGVQRLMDRGFDVTHGVMQDLRAAVLSAALAAEHDGPKEAAGTRQQPAAEWLQSGQLRTLELLWSEAGAPSLEIAVLRLVRKRFSNLILMPLDQIDEDRPLAKYGVDSMIAAEFRTWFWTAFKVDIPFLDLLSPEKNLNALAEFVGKKLVDDGGKPM
ncbi:polyketide synthase-like protein [Bombardia bombarda]|uniref:Polyketide synthase-like protein n=1 Tax=Bombardia bombarda TaxID=252184 RepID=A0AA39XJQ7_9PEZI|nr:polyketide synthase-like protein [Bombardia bombarda]